MNERSCGIMAADDAESVICAFIFMRSAWLDWANTAGGAATASATRRPARGTTERGRARCRGRFMRLRGRKPSWMGGRNLIAGQARGWGRLRAQDYRGALRAVAKAPRNPQGARIVPWPPGSPTAG